MNFQGSKYSGLQITKQNSVLILTQNIAAIADKAILYDPPGIGCKAATRWVEGQCCIAEPDTAFLIQVLIAKTGNAGIGIDIEPQDALYDGQIFFYQTLLVSCEPFHAFHNRHLAVAFSQMRMICSQR